MADDQDKSQQTEEPTAKRLEQARESGDVVRDNIEGIIVRPGDVDAIAAAIEHLYRHPEIVERMGAAARKRVVENFTWDHFRTRLLNAYEVAMARAT